MRNILICACARRIRNAIAVREASYLKHVSFLCLKQEMAMKMHIKAMHRQRCTVLLRKAMYALKRDSAVSQLTMINRAKQDWRRKCTLWTLLVRNIQIERHGRSSREKALEFKEFNLKMKAWTVLMKYFSPGETRFYSNSLLDLSNSPVRESAGGAIDLSMFDIAEHKRMSVLFSALRYGIKARTRAITSSEISYKH